MQTDRPAVPAPNADINVTPFLDVLLVLIIVFLSSVQARRALDAVLPDPCTGACDATGTSIVLEVLGGGRYRLNQRALGGDSLERTLRGVYAGRPDKILQVAGHRGARYQEVVSAMDAARSAGVRVISIPPSTAYATP